MDWEHWGLPVSALGSGLENPLVTFLVTVGNRENPGKSLDCNFVTVALDNSQSGMLRRLIGQKKSSARLRDQSMQSSGSAELARLAGNTYKPRIPQRGFGRLFLTVYSPFRCSLTANHSRARL